MIIYTRTENVRLKERESSSLGPKTQPLRLTDQKPKPKWISYSSMEDTDPICAHVGRQSARLVGEPSPK